MKFSVEHKMEVRPDTFVVHMVTQSIHNLANVSSTALDAKQILAQPFINCSKEYCRFLFKSVPLFK